MVLAGLPRSGLGAEELALGQPRAVDEFASLDAFSPFDLHGFDLHIATFAADDIDGVAIGQQASVNLALRGQRRISRPPPDLADLPAEAGVGAGPGGEPSHTVVDLADRKRPIDQAMLLFEQWRVARLRGVLRDGPDLTAL